MLACYKKKKKAFLNKKVAFNFFMCRKHISNAEKILMQKFCCMYFCAFSGKEGIAFFSFSKQSMELIKERTVAYGQVGRSDLCSTWVKLLPIFG